jgi:hypothetical protein
MTKEYVRKTIQIKSTFYVAVPLEWAEKNKLHKHGFVSISLPGDGSLKITNGAKQ